MIDDSDIDENDLTGPAGMGINKSVILSFAQVLNNSNMKKLDTSGVMLAEQTNNGQVDHSINHDPFEWPQVEDRNYQVKDKGVTVPPTNETPIKFKF